MAANRTLTATGRTFVILVWGASFVCTDALLRAFSPLEIQLVRGLVAWCALAALCPRDFGLRDVRTEGLFAAMGFVGIGLYQILETCSIRLSCASNVGVLMSAGPLVTALVVRLLTRRAVFTRRLSAGLALAVAGSALVASNGVLSLGFHPFGDLLVVVAMFCWAFYSALIPAALDRGISWLAVARKTFFWALVFLLPVAAWGMTADGRVALDGAFAVRFSDVDGWARLVRPLNLLNFAALGVFASAGCHAIWNVVCRARGTVPMTVWLSLTPVVAVALGVVCLGDRIGLVGIVGMVLTTAGVLLGGDGFGKMSQSNQQRQLKNPIVGAFP